MVDIADVALAIGLGVVATTLVLVFVFIFRQLNEIKRQVSALRVQVGTLRFQAADRSRDKPSGGHRPAAQPPEGVRRKGNLWVVPMLFGPVVGIGRSLRGFVYRHRAPIAAVTAGALTAAATLLYLGGAFRHVGNYQATPPTAPHTVTVPPEPQLPSHPAFVQASSRRPRSIAKPTASTFKAHADVMVVIVAPREEHPSPPSTVQQASVRHAFARPATTAPAPHTTAPVPTPTPSPSARCMRLSSGPLTREGLCLAGP